MKLVKQLNENTRVEKTKYLAANFENFNLSSKYTVLINEEKHFYPSEPVSIGKGLKSRTTWIDDDQFLWSIFSLLSSVTRKKLPNIFKSCPKMISLEK